MMLRRVLIHKGTYRDSVELMRLNEQLRRVEGITDAAILMGSTNNKARMAELGWDAAELASAEANDLLLGLQATSQASMDAALSVVDDFLRGHSAVRSAGQPRQAVAPRTLDSALRALPGANLVSISLPGEYSAAEARKALERGLHVFLFSSHVPLEEERQLKDLAAQRGLLMMGADCGTAWIHGQPLGFCSQLSPGPVGLVASSGTGAQEVASLVEQAGVGISHILGTGGRDLDTAIGGSCTRLALAALDNDPSTHVNVIVSKATAPEMEAQVVEWAAACRKPVVLCFVAHPPRQALPKGVLAAAHLAQAAQLAVALAKGGALPEALDYAHFVAAHAPELDPIRPRFAPAQRWLRGLFSGGSLTSEAAWLAAGILPEVHGPGGGAVRPIHDFEVSRKHMLLDLGDERFTLGRPHPMIDPGLRLERLLREARDPAVAVLLLDVVLGHNAHPDPSGALAPAIAQARAEAEQEGRHLAVLAHVCGTAGDPQNLQAQCETLAQAGCLLYDTNVEATYAAAYLVHDLAQGG